MTGDPAAFRRALLDHFDRHRRPLPWRSRRTPYRVMVSEVMLQQTRAETVLPYYERWLRRFPGWDSLAGAPLDEVLREWKGLGYYRRARSLHRMAQVVRERFGGRLPEDPEELRELPGVGPYTAGAVASIAFGRVVPAVDGNVRRVLSRLLDLEAPSDPRLGREAARLIDPERPGDFNEAMMELGATVCTPRSPACGRCPVEEWCRARAEETVAERPAPRPRRRTPRVEYAAVLAVAEGKALLMKRPDAGLLAGMWEFPCVEVGTGDGKRDHAAAALRLLGGLGLRGDPVAHLDPVRHAFSHLRATYRPVVVSLPRPATPVAHPNHHPSTPPTPAAQPDCSPSGHPRAATGPHAPAIWSDPSRLDDLAVPVAQQRIAALLTDWLRGTHPRASG